MSRKLSEIRLYTPNSSMANIQADPAKNSTMANVKKLYDVLEGKDDIASRTLRERLGTVIDAYEGKIDESYGDSVIDFIHGPMHALYLTNHKSLDDPEAEKQRVELRNLLEYVAIGLDDASGFNITEEQKKNVAEMEKSGRAEVKLARKAAIESKSGYATLEEHKAAINALPKKFKGAGADIQKAAARQQLKKICIDIMATRRSIEAKRNDKKGLQNANMNADLLDSIKADMIKSQAVDDFLNDMSYEDLRKLAGSGHGGAMEEKFAEYLKSGTERIPADAPMNYMPTAKEHIEALQDKLDARLTPGEQRKLYVELLASRATVGAKRNSKATLNPVLNPQYLDQERKLLEQEPLSTALVRITDIDGRYKTTLDAACKGHGGGLEDILRDELRIMAMEKESGYKMQNVDRRYAPTYNQRRQDLKYLINSKKLSLKDQFRAAVELGTIKDDPLLRGQDGNITDIERINRQTDERVAFYSRVMDEADMMQFVENTRARGYEEARRTFERAHAGELKANRIEDDINRRLDEPDERKDLPKLAAQKMVMLKHRQEFQRDKDNEKLEHAMDLDMDREVNKLMKDHLFKEVCEKLGTKGLIEYAKGDGSKLVESYGLAKEDKLQPYEAKAPVVKSNPQKGVVNQNPAPAQPLI